MTAIDNRLCAECGNAVEHHEHAIFGCMVEGAFVPTSPTFHGFVDSGQRAPVSPWVPFEECAGCAESEEYR